jgi:hypothetical protein
MSVLGRGLLLAIIGLALSAPAVANDARQWLNYGLGETARLLNSADTDPEKARAFAYLRAYLSGQTGQPPNLRSQSDHYVETDLYTYRQALAEFDYLEFDPEPCAEYRSYIFHQFNVDPEQANLIGGAPGTFLEFVDLACPQADAE